MIGTPLRDITPEIQDLVGLRLLEVHRIFYEEPEDERLMIDGHVFLVFDNEVEYSFVAFTEKFSLYYYRSAVGNRPERCVDISNDRFWRHRLGQRVKHVELIHSIYTTDPYGLRFILENDACFALEYGDDHYGGSDALIIMEGR